MKRFKDYSPDQQLLLPPDLNDWLEEGHLAYFIRDVVGELDLSRIYDDYHSRRGGQPAYEPQMMVSLLLYSYCVEMPSSRKIEKATYEQVPFRVLAVDQHPDHDTICTFRRRYLEALSELLAEAEAVDSAEDERYGVGNRGDELPEELRYRQQRLARIRQAEAALEAQASQEQGEADDDGDEQSVEVSNKPPPKPNDRMQRN